MPLSTLILVRHGATVANVHRPHLLQGLRPNHPLIEQGRRQAWQTGQALKTFSPPIVYTSPLQRAVESASIIAQALEVDISIEPGLVEADVGQWAGLTWTEVEQKWPQEYHAFQDDAEHHGYLGGENLAQVRDRAWTVLHRLRERHPGEALIIVSHAVINRVVLTAAMGLPLRYARKIPQDNGAYNILECSDNVVHVKTVNAFRLASRRSLPLSSPGRILKKGGKRARSERN